MVLPDPDGADTMKIWHATTGVCLDELSEHEGGVLSGFVSPDGLASLHTSVDGTCCVSNVETGACVDIGRTRDVSAICTFLIRWALCAHNV